MQHILSLVRRCVEDYHMIESGDTVAVGVSGGKDSVLTLAALARLRSFYPKRFEVAAVTIDSGAPGMDFTPIARLCQDLEVPYHLVSVPIYEIIFVHRQEKNPCSLCAKLRRGALSTEMNRLGLSKIALGHHFSDVIETTLLGLFYGAQLQAMPPKLRSKNFPGMELIRPLYCVHEDAIVAWKNYNHLRFLQCACRFTEARDASGDGIGESKRQEMKLLLRRLKQENPNIEKSIFRAIHGVQLDTFPGFKYRGAAYSLLDVYNSGAAFSQDSAGQE